ncbi:MAG: WXG100 family type VII secretion target [Oscillospiraceae bacterium]
MQGKLKINTSSLDADVASIENKIGDAKRNLEKIVSEITALNSMWEGPAKETFEAQFRADCELMYDVLKNYSAYSENLKDASSEYKRCISEVDDYINSIQIG